MNQISDKLPQIYTVEFTDGDVVHIDYPDRTGARALAIAQRIQDGKPYDIEAQTLRVWRNTR